MYTTIAIVAGIFSLLFAWAFVKTLRERNSTRGGAIVVGRVTGYRESRTRGTEGGGYTLTKAPVIEIEHNGTSVTIDATTHYSTHPKHSVGDTIEVRLNAADPKASLIAGAVGENQKWIAMLVALLICAGVCVGAMVLGDLIPAN